MSHSNFASRAKVHRAKNGEFHLLKHVPSHQVNPHAKIKHASGRETNILGSQMLNLHRKLTEYVITPSTAIANNLFTAQGFVNFRLNPTPIITHGLDLEITVLNTDGTNAKEFGPAPFILDRYEVFSAGSSSPLNTIRGDQIYLDICQYYTKEQLTAEASRLNINPTTFNGSGTTISAGASATYSFPILGSMFYHKLFLGTIQPIDIRIYIRGPDSLVSNPGSGPIQITDIKLRLYGEEMPQDELDAMVARYKKESHSFRVVHNLHRQITQAFSPNTTYTIQLPGMGGLVFESTFSFRSSITGSGLFTFSGPTSIEILDNSGVSLNNSQAIPVDYLVKSVAARHYPSGFTASKTVLYLPYVENPGELVMGSLFNKGYEAWHDNQLRVVSGSLNGSFYLDVFLKTYSLLTIDHNGNIHIELS